MKSWKRPCLVLFLNICVFPYKLSWSPKNRNHEKPRQTKNAHILHQHIHKKNNNSQSTKLGNRRKKMKSWKRPCFVLFLNICDFPYKLSWSQKNRNHEKPRQTKNAHILHHYIHIHIHITYTHTYTIHTCIFDVAVRSAARGGRLRGEVIGVGMSMAQRGRWRGLTF